MAEQLLPVNSVELCVDTYGTPTDPALVLVAGITGSMDVWDPAFCEVLAAGGRYVIRYDQRDTGRATACPPGAPDYSFADLVDDVAALIGRLAAGGRAHLAGISMGGAVVQSLAITQPEKVLSLTLIATSPVFPADVPPPTPELLAVYQGLTDPDWDDPESVVDQYVYVNRAHAGADFFDEQETRDRARHILARTRNIESSVRNHNLMKDDGRGPTGDRRALVAAIAVPALVLHGTADPMFAVRHAEVLAGTIPGARLLLLDGVGHQPPPRATWDRVVPAILATTAG